MILLVSNCFQTNPLKMPAWSYIPNSTLSYSCVADAAFHPATWQAAFHRIKPALFKTFGNVTLKKLHFLHRLIEGVMRHRNSHAAYQVVFEAFGAPLFCLRNLAHTLQDPADRMVYVIHLEDALHGWWVKKGESLCWESTVLLGIAGLLGLGLAYLFIHMVPSCNWCGYTRPPALLNMFYPPLLA
jgi:hypothetical protein